MRLLSLLIIYSLFFGRQINAQNQFQKFYEANNIPTFSIEELDTNRFLTSIGWRGMSILDSNGDVSYFKNFSLLPFGNFISFKKINNNLFYFNAVYIDTCSGIPAYTPMLGKIDSLGNVVSGSVYKFNGNCENMDTRFNIKNDLGIIASGSSRRPCNTCPASCFVFSLDSALNLQWAKYYTNHLGGAQFAYAMPNGNLILGLNLDSCGASLACLDSNGNTIWCKSYFRPRAVVFDCIPNADGSIIITGLTDSTFVMFGQNFPPGFAPKLFIVKIDSAGQVLWAKGLDDQYHWAEYPSTIRSTSDGNYLIMATALARDSTESTLLIKINSNGDTLWTRNYGIPGYQYFGYNVIESADKSIIIGGDAYGNFPGGYINSSFFYKTDSMGGVNCHQFNWQYTLSNIFPADSDMILSSIDGGTSSPAILPHDTTPVPYSIYDACVLIDRIILPPHPPISFSIRPNPTNGIVYVRKVISPTYVSDCYYSLYNMMGNLLLQHAFANGNQETEINLTKFGKGIYLLRITDGEKVTTNKIVVE